MRCMASTVSQSTSHRTGTHATHIQSFRQERTSCACACIRPSPCPRLIVSGLGSHLPRAAASRSRGENKRGRRIQSVRLDPPTLALRAGPSALALPRWPSALALPRWPSHAGPPRWPSRAGPPALALPRWPSHAGCAEVQPPVTRRRAWGALPLHPCSLGGEGERGRERERESGGLKARPPTLPCANLPASDPPPTRLRPASS
jgi:hypothetical protein